MILKSGIRLPHDLIEVGSGRRGNDRWTRSALEPRAARQ